MNSGLTLSNITQFHENRRIIDLASTHKGAIFLWVAATILVLPLKVWALPPFILLVMLLPDKRATIMSIGSLSAIYILLGSYGVKPSLTMLLSGLIVLALTYLIYLAGRHFHKAPPFAKRNSQIILHVTMWICLILAVSTPDDNGNDAVSGALVALAFCLPYLVWRAGYVLLSGKRKTMKKDSFSDHLFYLLPVFGGTHTPYGKGSDYLKTKKSNSRESFTISQLAGIKLLLLAWVWRALIEAITILVYGEPGEFTGATFGAGLGVMRLSDLLTLRAGIDIAIPLAWASLFLDFFVWVLQLIVNGHFIIGVLRLFGFNVFRNSYKPFLSRSIVDFWGRCYFYFKELLVEFFFYPTYLNYFKKKPDLRIFVAVMAAIPLGNYYYHLIMWVLWGRFSITTFEGFWTLLAPYVIYSTLLGLGIYVSMVREKKRRALHKAADQWYTIARKIFGVWAFHAIVRIWDEAFTADIMDRTHFFLSLLGITC